MRIFKFLLFVPLIFMMLAYQAEAAKPLKPQRVKSYQVLKRLLAQRQQHINGLYDKDIGGVVSSGPIALASAVSGSPAPAPTHSETNVQVAGVDEGDAVKTDGNYIYQIADSTVRLVRAYPSSALAQVAELKFDDNFYPSELYVEGNRLVVLGNAWKSADDEPKQPAADNRLIAVDYWIPDISLAAAKIYDISDKANPRLERELTLEGDLLSSRKIGDSIYFVSRNYPRYYFFAPRLSKRNQSLALNSRDNLIPHVSDTAVNGGAELRLPLSKLYYFPDFVDPDYVMVAGFHVDQPAQPADIKAYYGSGDIIYASMNNLYLSAADYAPRFDANGTEISNPVTHIYKFALDDAKTSFLKQGEVPGTVLNQFSMDENAGHFRIATTVNRWSWDGTTSQNDSWSNLYVLDDEMKQVGALENLAQGERIYAARFIGERCYLVTFRQTDPLFVVDLATPAEPKVLGELKIPGFSNYLHPFDSTHIIGFGREADENGVTQGMKVALFDVSDVSSPKLQYNLTLGDQGSYSPLLYDHKALWFDKERQLLGFPVQIYTKVDPPEPDYWWWNQPLFEGAYVYKLTLEGGFEKQAEITHQQDPKQWDYYSYIDRLLTIDDQLYTISNAKIQSQNLTDFAPTGSVEWQAPQYGGPFYLDDFLVKPAPG